ncbi:MULTISPECIES: cobyrinate a,c-diamide synthase [unclassified Fusibacter]|uniref:cobyrinate a,c-diamide synthase n=1 Tax=unclassified Fusibacter TaxID=2624464 RepID=UPI001011C9EF|nr:MULTISPECIES: cobyrinate a,c-diamide synthase [unclassified Fusibacter]MCK8059762.1 cobyrinate a,c-diamide synthase [Fusibacter sp. A2]NPE21563.1 cobyrinate a,c-diamide synthase [Fusibacter sp. A1]RXV61971.1 cobyrinate a,c-diamide synthase [Fusibacter sp. A1]
MAVAFMVAGASSNVGKTTVTSTLMHVLKSKGLTVQAFKCGPDYLDPTFHAFVTGRPSINLDLHMMGQEGVRESFHRHMQGVDVGVVEGVMGMFDGGDSNLDNGSAAHLSRILGIPVILIVDGSGVATTLAASVLGFKLFDERVDLKGVLVNKVGSGMHYSLLKEPIERYTGVKTLGYIEKHASIDLDSRHLGLKPASEVENLSGMLDFLKTHTDHTVDYEELLKSDFEYVSQPVAIFLEAKAEYRIAVAMDAAFYFYYQDNLDTMRRAGMELVPFSPIKDTSLPKDIDAIYIGGGYPELHAKALSENKALLKEIRKSSQEGLPIYAECGGMMYLTRSIEDMNGTAYEMVGVFDGRARMTEKLQRFGYVDVHLNEDTILGVKGTELKGHEFHRSTVDWNDTDLCYTVKKSYRSTKTWRCGAYVNHTLGAYAHLHFGNRQEVLEPLLECIRKRRTANG